MIYKTVLTSLLLIYQNSFVLAQSQDSLLPIQTISDSISIDSTNHLHPNITASSIDSTISDSTSTILSNQDSKPLISTNVTISTAPSAKNDTTLNDVPLKNTVDTMVVKASYSSREKGIQSHTAITFSSKDIAKTAGAADDISRYLGTMPSIVSALGAKYDNTLYVRGGRSSEILFFIDGLEFENINHFSQQDGSGGPIGFINPDFIRKVRYYAGNAPASYPAKMSSIIDVDMKSGSFTKTQTSAGIRLNGVSASIEGPVLNHAGSFAFAARYIDFRALQNFMSNEGIPKLGDFFAKLMFPIGKNMYISATGLAAYNGYDYIHPYILQGDDGAKFTNQMHESQTILQGGAGLAFHYKKANIEHQAYISFSTRNGKQQDSLGSYPDSFTVLQYAKNPIEREQDKRTHVTAHSQSTISINQNHSLSLGFRYNKNFYFFEARNELHHHGDYTACTPSGPVFYTWDSSPRENVIQFNGSEYGGFLDYNAITGMLHSSIGLRAEYYNLLDDFAFSPTISEMVSFGNAGNFLANAGIYHQFPTDLPTILFNSLTIMDSLSPAQKEIMEKALLKKSSPLQCYQASIGYDIEILGLFQPKLELYYKWYNKEYHYIAPGNQNTVSFVSPQELEIQPQTGIRKSYGIELSVSNINKSWCFYSVGGSIFKVKNKFFDTEWYNDWTNVGYTYTLSLGASFLQDHSFSLGLQGTGGRPYCAMKITPDCMNRNQLSYDMQYEYYSQHLDPLLTTSIRYGFTKKISTVKIEAFLEIINLFNYKPILEYKYNGIGFDPIRPFGFTLIPGISVYF